MKNNKICSIGKVKWNNDIRKFRERYTDKSLENNIWFSDEIRLSFNPEISLRNKNVLVICNDIEKLEECFLIPNINFTNCHYLFVGYDSKAMYVKDRLDIDHLKNRAEFFTNKNRAKDMEFFLNKKSNKNIVFFSPFDLKKVLNKTESIKDNDIGKILVISNLNDMKAAYEDDYITVIGCFDSVLFLNSKDHDTCHLFSQMLGKVKTSVDGSKYLMSVEELVNIDKNKGILIIRGIDPFVCEY